VDNYLKVKSIVEKPPKGSEPSNLISIGRYLFTSEIFSLLENGFKNHTSGEFYHIDSINTFRIFQIVFAKLSDNEERNLFIFRLPSFEKGLGVREIQL